MEYILSIFLSYLLVYKYLGLFIICFLGALLLPVPSSSLLAAAGAFSAQGYFNIYSVLFVSFIANILGDGVGYFIARHYGVKVLQRNGLRKIIASRAYTLLTGYIQNFSYSLIFFSRFLTGVGPLVTIISGLTHVRPLIFFGVSIIGEITYVLLYGLTGYYLGSEWENNLGFLFEATTIIILFGITITTIQYGVFTRMKKLSRPL